jgi:hypothetical protein
VLDGPHSIRGRVTGCSLHPILSTLARRSRVQVLWSVRRRNSPVHEERASDRTPGVWLVPLAAAPSDNARSTFMGVPAGRRAGRADLGTPREPFEASAAHEIDMTAADPQVVNALISLTSPPVASPSSPAQRLGRRTTTAARHLHRRHRHRPGRSPRAATGRLR